MKLTSQIRLLQCDTDERRVEVGRHAGRLADHAARTFLRGVDDGQQFVVTELVARGDLVLDLFLHAQGHLLECQFAQLQDIVLREEVRRDNGAFKTGIPLLWGVPVYDRRTPDFLRFPGGERH